MPSQNPIYQNYQLLKATLLENLPNLTLITSEEAFNELLNHRVVPPSKIRITMENKDRKRHTATAADFVKGHNKILTEEEMEKMRTLLVEKGHQTRARERDAIKELGDFFLSQHLNFANLTQVIENGKADGCIGSAGSTSSVGCQVTYADASGTSNRSCSVAKSKNDIVEKVVNMGFLFTAMLYEGNKWRGVISLSPNNSDLIESLPDFDTLNINLGKNGIQRIEHFQKGSVANTLVTNNCMFIWTEGNRQLKQEAWMRAVQHFLDNPDNKKYTFEEFESMVCSTHAVEKQSIEEFANLRGITGVKRMVAGAFGDINFVVNNVLNFQAEMKVALQTTTTSLIPSFVCSCYRDRHDLAKCANSVSVFIVAIPAVGVTVADKRYGHFLLFPTRTGAGAPNLRPDHEAGYHEHLYFKFDRSKRSLLRPKILANHRDTTKIANWAEFIVLVPGQDITPENIEKLVNWSSRPLVALDCSPPTSRKRVIQSDEDEPLADGSPVSKRRRHIWDEDD